MSDIKLGGVLLAAGSSSRFGSNKLLFPVGGIAMAEYTMRLAVAAGLHKTVVVTAYPEVVVLAKAHNLEVVINDQPQMGQAHSVKTGLQHCLDCDGCIFFVCDQPNLGLGTVKKMAEAFRAAPERIICASWQGKRGSPVIFPQRLFSRLMQLGGDEGGRQVIRENPGGLVLINAADPTELQDIDYNR